FIEPILEALAQGRPVNATHTLAVGCFCQWATPAP
ncbi:thiol-disulfide isomerase, partial [Pseudomonas aeruginosa]